MGRNAGDTINCAKFYYGKLISSKTEKVVKETIKASFIAALQQKTQEILDSYVSIGRIKYNSLEAYGEILYAEKLAGKNYMLYNYIAARVCFLSIWYGGGNGSTVQLIHKALQFEKDAPYGLNELGAVYAYLKQPDSALFYYKKTIAVAPDWFIPYNNIGTVYFGTGNYDKAIECFKTAIRLDTLYATAYYNMGLTYTNLNDYKTSITMYKKAIAIDSTNCDFYSLLGMSYIYIKDYGQGFLNLKKALLINPGKIQGNYNLACGYSLVGDTKNGILYLKKILTSGFLDYRQLMQDEDLANIRKTAEFNDLMKHYFPGTPK
jgi:tetratricopeptide (TPR) repeat protein